MTSGAAAFVAIIAFSVPLAMGTSANAQTTTTTDTTTVPSSTTTVPASSTTSSTTASTTTTTQAPTTTTTTPPVQGAGIVVIGGSGYRLLADGTVGAVADGDVLARTGSSSTPVWLTGLACLVSGAFALTFKQRRHLSLYTLQSKRS